MFHVSEFESPLHPAWREGEHEDGEQLFDSIFLYLAPAVALANLILHGVLERFPLLRIGVVELTASWVPSFLLHLDGASDFYTQRHGEPFRALASRPSEYFLRQVRVAALPYEMPNRLVPKVGEETFMIGSDWPHAEGVADPMGAAERAVAGLSAAAGQTYWVPTRTGCSVCDDRPQGRRRRAGTVSGRRTSAQVGRRPDVHGAWRAPPGLPVLRRRTDDPFLPGAVGLPVGRALQEPGLQGVDPPLLRPGPRQHARLLRLPRTWVWSFAEVLGGFHHLAISVSGRSGTPAGPA